MGDKYLSLTRYGGEFIAVYRRDEKGIPILNDGGVLVIKVTEANSRVKLNFNGDNYGVVRTKVLTRELKAFVDKRIRRLEGRV
jgi:hypothetical protein